MNYEEALGVMGTDKVTGFTGEITGYTRYLFGCDQLLLKPIKLTKEGAALDGNWFDYTRITLGKRIHSREDFKGSKDIKVKETITGPDIPGKIK